jgi:hypothetical protein
LRAADRLQGGREGHSRGIPPQVCLDPCHWDGKAVASAGDGLDAAPPGSPLVEYPPERSDLHVQIVVADCRQGPYGGDYLIPRDEISCSLDEHTEDVERTRADPNRHESAAVLAPEQDAGAPVETKTLEEEHTTICEPAHTTTLSPNVLKFSGIYNFLFRAYSALPSSSIRSLVRLLSPSRPS